MRSIESRMFARLRDEYTQVLLVEAQTSIDEVPWALKVREWERWGTSIIRQFHHSFPVLTELEIAPLRAELIHIRMLTTFHNAPLTGKPVGSYRVGKFFAKALLTVLLTTRSPRGAQDKAGKQ